MLECKNAIMKRLSTLIIACAASLGAAAQSFQHYITTEQQQWQTAKRAALSGRQGAGLVLTVSDDAQGHVFKAWGTCFNELDLDALELLKPDEQEDVMRRIFAPDGDLRFTRGRLTMNANDYSRAWYSCDTVAGDFQLRCFNIEHDKQNVIRLIHRAQKYQPQMTFWMSPWSPPAWMKINQDYPVCSSEWNEQAKEKDYLLFSPLPTIPEQSSPTRSLSPKGEESGQGEGAVVDPDEMKFADGQRGSLFPKKLASQTYFIQDPRYLQAYANMFCRFIELYAEENIPINMVMYQNEAYSYTPYPGCAWTADGTLRFNRDYLIPTLRDKHPEVEVNIGTLNTNRLDYVSQFIDGLKDEVKAVGLQWEGRQIIDSLRQRYPGLHFISTESECGNGQMNWQAGEHTFHLLADYIGKGCDEYYIWNFILCDQGRSAWGWNQNALVQVCSSNLTFRYTPEFYAVKHFSHFVEPDSRMLGYVSREQNEGMPVIVFQRPDHRYVVIAGNQTDNERSATVRLGKKYLNITLQPHSFHTFVQE